jgi:rhodanese-related sulfurtransferase
MMKISSFSAGLMATAILVALPATSAWSASRAEAESAIAAAEEARKKAASVGGEWRDTDKMIKKAATLLDTREYTKAIKIANEAKLQGEIGHDQAMDQKDAGFPDYMVALAGDKPAVAEMEIGPIGIEAIEVTHNGEKVTIERGHDKEATLPEEFLKTDRTCPPFCVQPMSAGEGVETLGEVEMVEYLKQAAAGEPVLVMDSRTADWVQRGTIPGSVNIPWDQIDPQQQGMFGDSGQNYVDTLMTEQFGVVVTEDGSKDFSNAKTLVLFCNGIWCGQSTSNIATLMSMGYPADKLKWYRGGLQDWVSVGLTTVK